MKSLMLMVLTFWHVPFRLVNTPWDSFCLGNNNLRTRIRFFQLVGLCDVGEDDGEQHKQDLQEFLLQLFVLVSINPEICLYE